jgi:hypothetical protein
MRHQKFEVHPLWRAPSCSWWHRRPMQMVTGGDQGRPPRGQRLDEIDERRAATSYWQVWHHVVDSRSGGGVDLDTRLCGGGGDLAAASIRR